MKKSRKIWFGVLCFVVILGLTIPISSAGGATSAIGSYTQNISAPTDPAPAPTGKIAFVSNRDGNDEIYVMNVDGSGQTRLTNDPGRDAHPSWSPDGSKIAFYSSRYGADQICVMNADGSNVERLTTSGYNRGPAWSPDGSKIAFYSDRDDGTHWQIYVMNPNGSGQTRITSSPANGGHPAWSPDGSKIAFQSNRDGNDEIYVMNADGSAQTRLTYTTGGEETASWSPDGLKIAFCSQRDGNWEIYVMNADGSGQTNPTNNPAGDRRPAWSPDGSRIAFISERDGGWEVYIMNPDGLGQTRLTTNGFASDWAPSWAPLGAGEPTGLIKISPDNNPLPAFKWNAVSGAASYEISVDSVSWTNIGNRLTFVQPAILSKGTHTFSVRAIDASANAGPVASLNFNISVVANLANTRICYSSGGTIWVSNPDFSNPTMLTNGPGEGFQKWSPDGTKIVFQSQRDGNSEIYVMNADGSGQTRLTDTPANEILPCFSPDGAKIAFSTNANGNNEIYIMNADGSGQTRLTYHTENTQFNGAHWSPDGSRIVFLSGNTTNRYVCVVNVDGSGFTCLTNDNLANNTEPSWSPDGTRIAFLSDREHYQDTYQLYLMNPDGTNQTRITTPSPEKLGWPEWSPDGSKLTLLYSETVAYSYTSATINADGSGLNVSPNGRPNGLPSWSPFLGGGSTPESYAVKTGAEVESTWPNSQRKLATTSDGHLHAVYHRKDASNILQIYYAESLDEGQTWSEEPLTNEIYDQKYPAIAVDGADNLHVVWEGCHSGSTSHPQIRYRKCSASWGGIINITNDTGWDQRTPVIAVDSDDHLHVVWQKLECVGGAWCQEGCGPLYCSKYEGYWSTPQLIGEGNNYNDILPTMAIDNNDYIHVAWSAGGYWNADCWHTAYRQFTDSWQPPVEFECYACSPSIAVDNVGNVHMVTRSIIGDGLKYRKKTDGSWGNEATLAAIQPSGEFPSIAVDSNNSVHVVWNENGSIKHREYTTSWQSSETIISDTDSTYPNSLWAFWPEVGGQRTNVPQDGYSFIWMDGTTIRYWPTSPIPPTDTTPPTVDGFSVTPDSQTLGNPFTISYTVSDTGGSGLKQVELWRAIDVNSAPDPGWPGNPIATTAISGNSYTGSFSDAPFTVGTYWYGIHVVDNASNWAAEAVPAMVHVTTVDNTPPIGNASSMAGSQPKNMYPDVTYTVTAAYHDLDGMEDLKYCYLRLNHPTKPLTMMWSQSTDQYSAWAGEEGANYLTVSGTTVPMPDSGYDLNWSFTVNSSWPETENAIDFGVFASDDNGLTSGWNYDETNASFIKCPVIVTPLDITPTDTLYYVGDTITATFSLKNIGDEPITLDKLLVGGRFNGGKLSSDNYPDFTLSSATLGEGETYSYTGTLRLTEAGKYHFFCAYHSEARRACEDDNNWNSNIGVMIGERIETDSSTATSLREKDIVVAPEWRRDLQVGDILLHRKNQEIACLGFDMTHSGIYVGDGYTVEALADGASKYPIEKWDYQNNTGGGSDTWVELRRVDSATPDQRIQAAKWAIAQSERDPKPEFETMLGLLFKSSDPNSDGWYCSELVWAAYKNQGVELAPWYPAIAFVSPDQLTLTTRLVAEHKEQRPVYLCNRWLQIRAMSPVSLVVTDPDGLIVTKEYSHIPGGYYNIIDVNVDRHFSDIVSITDPKLGNYAVEVIPDPSASSTETFTLTSTTGGITLTLAENVQLSDIPTEPYQIRLTTEQGVDSFPIADGNGPYTAAEGSSVSFSGSGSYDPDGNIVLYEWDLNNDGIYDYSSTSPTATYTWGDEYLGKATLRVTDIDGLTSTDKAEITVNNVAPAAEAGTNQKVEVFAPVSLAGSFVDPGWLDTHTIEWDFGDGTGASGTLTATHSYNMVGVYTVTLTVTDDDQGVGTDSLNVEVIQKYAIWGNSTNTNAIVWSGSGAKITGNVDSNGGVTMSGSNNVIGGTLYYGSTLTITGSKDTFTSKQKVSPRPMPVHYDLSAYKTGAQVINGNFNVSKSGTTLSGLYYVKGNVNLSASNIKGTFTIVAEGTISISGSGMNCTPYSGDLLFFANGSSMAMSGSNSSLAGIIYVPKGQIAISGSGNKINGSLFGDKVMLSGSNMVITAK